MRFHYTPWVIFYEEDVAPFPKRIFCLFLRHYLTMNKGPVIKLRVN
jgi:hypothetical protein